MREWVLHYKDAIRISLLAMFRWTLLAVCTGVLCGGSAGREGAALQMGGSIGWNIGRVLHFNNHDCRTATVCGMAAFFSALFGTPLTATLFAMMVVDVGLMLTVAFVPGFLAALIAYGISLKAGIAPTRFVMEAPSLDARTVVRTAVLAMCWGRSCSAGPGLN